MRKVVFGINVTLDGVFDHTYGIANDELHEYFTKLLQTVDLVIFGRNTYQLMYPYWHTVAVNQSESKAVNEFARTYDSLERIVFSKTLKSVEWKTTRISCEAPEDEIVKLRQLPARDIAISSLDIASRLTRLGLIDEYHFVVHPVLAGRGKRLFDGEDLKEKLRLKLVGTATFNSGAVALHYVRHT